jgi:Acetyltransferase (GNAT) domain
MSLSTEFLQLAGLMRITVMQRMVLRMTLHNFFVGEYREQDISGILHLFALSFQKEVSEEWFEWKYKGAPWSAKGYVAVHEDRVVAFYGGIKMQFHHNEIQLWAYQLCDVMTHPRYRARLVSKTPLIAMLGEMLYRENRMDFAFGYPSLRHARLQSIRLGGEGYRLVRLYEKERLGRYSLFKRFHVEEGWEHTGLDNIADFHAHHNRDTLGMTKDTRYLKWRYRENPAKKYRLLIFSRVRIIKGYIIFSIEDDWCNILEIFYETADALKNLLRSLESYILKCSPRLKGIRAWFHPGEPIDDCLSELGYHSRDFIPIAFKLENATCGIDAEVFYDTYFYRMGDYDAS